MYKIIDLWSKEPKNADGSSKALAYVMASDRLEAVKSYLRCLAGLDIDATIHTSERMSDKVYEAKPILTKDCIGSWECEITIDKQRVKLWAV